MTARTLRRRAFLFQIRVAAFTFQVGMLAFQREESLMLERVHPVYPIVALQAIRAELRGVFGHESGVVIVVALDANLLIKRRRDGAMARRTGDRLALVIGGMFDQAKPIPRMVVKLALHLRGFPTFGGMAGGAVNA
jgi:hypothetical protein